MRRLIAVLTCLITISTGCVALLIGMPPATAAPATQSAGSYVSVPATRVFDSRASHPLAPSATVRFPVSGVGSIPSTGVAAVSVNITVLTPSRAGSLSVAPGGTTTAPLLSFRAGLTDQNDETVPLAGDGSLSIHNYAPAGVQVIADVLGYYLAGTPSAAGSYAPLPLGRIFDTRKTGAQGIPSGGSARVQVTGKGGVPAANVATALVNFTVLTPSRAGVLSVLPGGLGGSAVSVSFGAGVTEQSMLSTKLGADGSLTVRNLGVAAVTVVADVAGYFLAGTVADQGTLTSMVPTRTLDMRVLGSSGYIKPGATVDVHLLGYPSWPLTRPAGLPGFGIPALPLLVTVDRPSGVGSLAVYPSHTLWNRTVSITFAAHQPFQRMLTTQLGVDGAVTIRNTGATPIPLVADLLGYYFGRPAPLHATASQDIDPPHGTPAAVSCPSTSFCLAVESSGWALSYDGSTWSAPFRVPGATRLKSVSCTSATFCMAGGSGLFRFDGSSWTRTGTDQINTDNQVSCVTPTFCLAVTGDSYIRWDGAGWSSPQQPSSAYQVYAVSCASSTFCMFTTYGNDTGGTGAVRYDGHAFGSPTALGTHVLTDISCPTTAFCAAVGDYGAESHFSNGHWSTPATVGPGGSWQSVSCASATSCIAVDNGNDPGYRYDGTSWIATGTQHANESVSCASPTMCVAVSDSYLSAQRYDGTGWSSPVVLDSRIGALVGLSCVSASFCLALDGWGHVLRYDGSSWSTPSSIGSVSRAGAIACTSPTSCMVLGWNGEVMHFDGTSWTQQAKISGNGGYVALSCPSASFCAAVSGLGSASTFDGTTWQTHQLPVPSNAIMHDVSCVSASFCVAGSSNGTAYTWNGTAWSAGTQTPADQLGAVSCASADYCLQGGFHDEAVWSGGAWHQLPLPGAAPLGVLTCLTETNCIGAGGVSGDASELAQWNGSSWSMPVELPGGVVGQNDLGRNNTISCPTADFCMVLDNERAYRLDG